MRERIVKPRLGLPHFESLDVTKAISLKTALIRGGSLKRTRYGRKRVVRIASDQANRTNHQHQNHGQHDRILGDVLAPVVPQVAQKMTHIRTPVTGQFYAHVPSPPPVYSFVIMECNFEISYLLSPPRLDACLACHYLRRK